MGAELERLGVDMVYKDTRARSIIVRLGDVNLVSLEALGDGLCAWAGHTMGFPGLLRSQSLELAAVLRCLIVAGWTVEVARTDPCRGRIEYRLTSGDSEAPRVLEGWSSWSVFKVVVADALYTEAVRRVLRPVVADGKGCEGCH